MGTTGTTREKGMTDKEFFSREWTSIEILDTHRADTRNLFIKAKVKKTGQLFVMHVAIEHVRGEGNFHRAYTGEVYSTNFYYKECEETSGPYDVRCPLHFLDGLPEPANEWAAEWREKVREYNATRKAAPKIGQTIKFAAPLKFNNGSSHDTFTVVRHGKGRAFHPPGMPWALYKISKRALQRDFEVLPQDQPAISE